eukprot:1507159-Prymnesium_polylepis.2
MRRRSTARSGGASPGRRCRTRPPGGSGPYNHSVHVPVDGPSHAKLDVTLSGKTSAVRRVT